MWCGGRTMLRGNAAVGTAGVRWDLKQGCTRPRREDSDRPPGQRQPTDILRIFPSGPKGNIRFAGPVEASARAQSTHRRAIYVWWEVRGIGFVHLLVLSEIQRPLGR